MYLQFVLPQTFWKRTVIACHDKFGHLGMDKTLLLLQERFFWPKMSDDVRTHIQSCVRCMRFKQPPQLVTYGGDRDIISVGIGPYGFSHNW